MFIQLTKPTFCMKQVFNNYAKCGLFMAMFLFMSNMAIAQRTIKGKVSDADSGEGLIGATVSVVGTPRGSVTDLNGNYSVDVPAGATQLRFSYTGYAEQVVALTSANTLDVALASGTALDEVVVVGYGSLKAKEITSAVTSLKREDFNQGNISNASQLLQGKVAGVSVTRSGSDPNGGFAIRMRGLSSTQGGVQPLVVLDGVLGADLQLIDPNDIESIDVLKDGSASAIFGTRASAGVILITTKKGAAGKSLIEYNATVAVDQIARRYESLDEAGFLAIPGKDLYPNVNNNTNWTDQISQSGLSNTHNLSMSGGAGTFNYRASVNYRKQEGVLRNSGFDNYNGSLNFTQRGLNDRLTVSGSLIANQRNANYGFAEAFRYATVYNPTVPVKDLSNPDYAAYAGYVEVGGFDNFNPVAIIEQNINRGKISRLLGSLNTEIEIVSGLKAGVRVARERTDDNGFEYYSKNALFRGAGANGLAVRDIKATTSDLIESTLNYRMGLGEKGSLNLLGGHSWQEFNYDGFRLQAGGIASDFYAGEQLAAAGDIAAGKAQVSSYRNLNRLAAFFGRANLNWDDTYFLSAGLRREGSTRFAPANKWGVFPFASFGVDLTKAASLSSFDNLKLRGGYGVTGAVPIDANGSFATLAVSNIDGTVRNYPINGKNYAAFLPARNANSNVAWESKAEANVGIDFASKGSKLNGTVDLYSRTTSDALVNFNVATPSALQFQTVQNVAKIRTNGAELSLGYNVVSTEKLTWTPTLVFNTYKVTMVDYGQKDTLPFGNVGAPGQNDNFYTILANETPIGLIWGPQAKIVNGEYVYTDINKDGAININSFNGDQTRIGNGVPKFELGLTNQVRFGNIDVNLFLRGVVGHDLVNEFRTFYESNEGASATSPATQNKINSKYYNKDLKTISRFNSTHVEKASFLRIDNLTVGYNVALPSGSAFKKARVFINGQNLATFTGYTGPDPEVRNSDAGSVDNGNRVSPISNPLVWGVDRRSTYFLARTLAFGVNLGF
jgi:TonB-dependent starch-binding outer membrane protein SusC